jgi:hypothetical protein
MVMSVVILIWRSLNLPLSFGKGVRGQSVGWIGGNILITAESVIASVKQSILSALEEQIGKCMKCNVIARTELMSLAGRANHVAALLWTWRPFLQHLWAALYLDSASAPQNCVWVRQILSSIQWIAAFLHGKRGSLSRTFHLSAFMNLGTKISITIDASPWGLAAYMCESDVPVSWFSSEITDADCALYGVKRGDCEGQQIWESLASLVALRLWKGRWLYGRISLKVRGDNMTMLQLLVRLRPPTASRGLGLISREIALDIAEAAYSPDVSEHLPGIANLTADALSRKHEPGVCWSLPAALHRIPEAIVPDRVNAYYRTLQPN